jgi:peroxiredoxin
VSTRRDAFQNRPHWAAAVAVGVAVVLGVSGCAATDELATQYRAGSNKGYISGDGRVVEIAVEDRGEPVVFEGVLESGETVSSADYRGEVTVVNFWYAACGPCRVEAPFLEEVYLEFAGDGADFLGVNTYDQAPTALAFADTYRITYPSVIDVPDGKVKLAFAQVTTVLATPTTLVLDQQGRVAARISGQLDGPSTLRTIVRDVIAEGS